jgi:uncharacterized protein (UPF0335 family)
MKHATRARAYRNGIPAPQKPASGESLQNYFGILIPLHQKLAALNERRGDMFFAARLDGFDTKVMRLVLQRLKSGDAVLAGGPGQLSYYFGELIRAEAEAAATAKEFSGMLRDARMEGFDSSLMKFLVRRCEGKTPFELAAKYHALVAALTGAESEGLS